MIFINLLPDIKLEFVRGQRVMRLLVLLAVILITCCVVVGSLFYYIVNIQQPATIKDIEGAKPEAAATTTDDDATDDAATDAAAATDQTTEVAVPNTAQADPSSNLGQIAAIQSRKDIRKILTIQNQLRTLPSLHAQKTRPDRLFVDNVADDVAYLPLLIPEGSGGKIQSVTFDFVQNTFTITGTVAGTENNASVNALKIEATVEYMGYEPCTEDNRESRIYPFRTSGDVLPGSLGEEEEEVAFTLNGVFSPELFDRSISDQHFQKFQVPEEAVDDAATGQTDHNCLLPADDTSRLNSSFPKKEEEGANY